MQNNQLSSKSSGSVPQTSIEIAHNSSLLTPNTQGSVPVKYTDRALWRLHRRQDVWRSIRAEQAKKRVWWRTHVVSHDLPGSKAARVDYSDRGRAVARMISFIDRSGPYRDERAGGGSAASGQSERNRMIINAAVYVAHALGYRCGSPGYAEVLSIISSVALYGSEAREVIMRQFGLSYWAYVKRLDRYAAILKARPDRGGRP